MEFFNIKIKKITPETPEAVSIEFDIPADLQDKFEYKQGQYITLRRTFEGQELRRSYSMSSSPLENRLVVTVKKVAGGKMSTWLHDHAKAGESIEIAAPEGRFWNALDPEKRRTYYLFAAGSGITPVFSIAKTVLEGEAMSTVYLLYGNRNEENTIFRAELDRLSERYGGQMHVEYVLSQPKKEANSGGFFGLFKKTATNWQGKTGRIEGKKVEEFLDANLLQGPEHDAQYFVCGPGGMCDLVKTTLLGRGIAAKQVHVELFANGGTPGQTTAALGSSNGKGTALVVHLKGKRIETVLPDGMTVLDALVKERLDPPYSCTAGACATCMAKVINGKVKMDACYALDDDEVKAGYCLTCQARPDSATLEISYDM